MYLVFETILVIFDVEDFRFRSIRGSFCECRKIIISLIRLIFIKLWKFDINYFCVEDINEVFVILDIGVEARNVKFSQ